MRKYSKFVEEHRCFESSLLILTRERRQRDRRTRVSFRWGQAVASAWKRRGGGLRNSSDVHVFSAGAFAIKLQRGLFALSTDRSTENAYRRSSRALTLPLPLHHRCTASVCICAPVIVVVTVVVVVIVVLLSVIFASGCKVRSPPPPAAQTADAKKTKCAFVRTAIAKTKVPLACLFLSLPSPPMVCKRPRFPSYYLPS